jgi:hypothetical protein
MDELLSTAMTILMLIIGVFAPSGSLFAISSGSQHERETKIHEKSYRSR